MITTTKDLLDDVRTGQANNARVWLRRACLLAVVIFVLISGFGFFDRTQTMSDMDSGVLLSVEAPRSVRAGSGMELSVLVGRDSAETSAPSAETTMCVSDKLLALFSGYSVKPEPTSTGSCQSGTEWTFDRSVLLSQLPLTISGTVDDASAIQNSGSLSVITGGAAVSVKVDIWRIP